MGIVIGGVCNCVGGIANLNGEFDTPKELNPGELNAELEGMGTFVIGKGWFPSNWVAKELYGDRSANCAGERQSTLIEPSTNRFGASSGAWSCSLI